MKRTAPNAADQVQIVTVSISVAALLWTAFRGHRIPNAAHLLLLAVPCGVLGSHYAFIHDLSVLLLSTMVLVNFFLLYEGQSGEERWIGRSASFLFVVPLVESFFPEHFFC